MIDSNDINYLAGIIIGSLCVGIAQAIFQRNISPLLSAVSVIAGVFVGRWFS